LGALCKDLYIFKDRLLWGALPRYTNSPIGRRGGVFGWMGMARPKKNKDKFVGRAGREAIELEKRAREEQRWRRKRETIERFIGMK